MIICCKASWDYDSNTRLLFRAFPRMVGPAAKWYNKDIWKFTRPDFEQRFFTDTPVPDGCLYGHRFLHYPPLAIYILHYKRLSVKIDSLSHFI